MLAGVLLAVAAGAAEQETAELDKLKAQVGRLYQEGRYADAVPLAARAVELGEELLGPEHPDVARSLNNLANLYQDTGDYAKPGCLGLLRSSDVAQARSAGDPVALR